MASYPILTSGRTFMAPLVATAQYRLEVLKFADNSEQRFLRSGKLRAFTLTHAGISTTEKGTLETFFDGRKGDYDEFDLPLPTETIYHLRFDSTEFEAVQGDNETWTVTLAMHQWRS